mgnify:CR=1 FL=1
MLYMVSLNHSPDKCPGVAIEIRDRLMRMNATMIEVLQSHGCTLQGGRVSKGAHLTLMLIDGPNSHAIDDAAVDRQSDA